MLKTIATFRDKVTREFFLVKGLKDEKRLPKQPRSKLKILNRISSLQELVNAFDANLHRLYGDRKGQWAVNINRQYRTCFYWEKRHAYEVEITDYH